MKKTIIAMLALSGVAFGATTIDSKWDTAPTTAGNYFPGTWGLTFTLNETYTIANSGYVLGAFCSPSPNSDFGANAIYLTEGENGAFTLNVGRGKLSSTTIDKDTTFTLSDATDAVDGITWDGAIETGVTYQLVAAVLNGITGISVVVDQVDMGGTWSDTKYETEAATYKSNMNNGGPTIAITTCLNTGVEITPPTPAIPEPTTATLSLLALAGLAARRRRK